MTLKQHQQRATAIFAERGSPMSEHGQDLRADQIGEPEQERAFEDAAPAPIESGNGGEDLTLWLPDELMVFIFVRVGIIHATARVCKRWKRICGDREVQEASWLFQWHAYANEQAMPRKFNGHEKNLCALAIGLDGNLYSGSADRTIKVWSTQDGALLRTLTGHTDWVRTLAVGPEGNIYSGADDGYVRVWDGTTNELVGSIFVGGEINAVVANDTWLYTCSGRHIQVWDRASGRQETTMTNDMAESYITAWSLALDHDKLYAGYSDGTICVWSASQFKRLSTLMPEWNDSGPKRNDTVFVLALGPNGSLLSGLESGLIRVWVDGKERKVLRGHTSGVRSLVVGPSGTVISGSQDKTICVWPPGCLEPIVIRRHRQTVRALALSANGRLFSGCYAGSLLTW